MHFNSKQLIAAIRENQQFLADIRRDKSSDPLIKTMTKTILFSLAQYRALLNVRVRFGRE